MGDDKACMWEIFVPTKRNPPDDRSFRTRYHRVWDAKVRAITGGLTVMPVVRGQWLSPELQLFTERMIPVRVMATRAQIDAVIDLTMKYYDQLAVLAYRISDDVILKHRGEKR